MPDVIVLDLEYSVAPKHKEQARIALNKTLSMEKDTIDIFVRVDWKTRWCDIKAAVKPGICGIILPGPELNDEIKEIDEYIGNCEKEIGLLPRSIGLVLAPQSAKGFWNAPSLVKASPRVIALALDRVDLAMRLGQDAQGEFRLYPYLMSRVLTIAKALDKQPIGAHWKPGSRGGLASPKESEAAAKRAYQTGFTGCFCVRPEQVAAINQGFTPSSKSVKEAERIIQLYKQRRDMGGDYIEIDGRIYDDTKISCYQNTILFAKACAKRDKNKLLYVKKGTLK